MDGNVESSRNQGSGCRCLPMEARFRAIFEASRDAIGISRAGVHLFVNPAYLALFGFPADMDLAGTPILDIIAPESRGQIDGYIARRARGEAVPATYETRGRRADGSVFDMEVSTSHYRESDEVLTLVILRDITRHKRVEEALRLNELKFRRLYNETPVLLHSIDRNGTVVEVNDYWLQTLGYERGEVVGRHVTEFYSPESRRYALEVVQPAFFREGLVKDVAYQFVKKSGEVVDVLLSATAERGADGSVARSQAVIVDVTERRRAEAALRESEARFRMLYEGTPAMMHSIDARGVLVSVSDLWLRTLGYAREEVIGKRSTEFLDEPSRTFARERVLPEFMRTGACADVPYTFVTKAGARIFTLLSAIAERDAAGEIVRSLAVIVDVTERRRAEAALRESEERFRDLAESLPLTIFEMDLQGRLTYVNQAALETFGYTREQFADGVTFDQVISPADRERALEAMARRISGDPGRYSEYQARRSDGSTFPVTVASSPILRYGAPVGFRGIVINLLERRQLEEERLKTQKLESVGTLAGGIAHDFNNLLQGVFGYISMARMTIDQRERALAMLGQAEKALHQSVNLTSQLLTFARGGKPVMKPISLKPLIENTVSFALSGSRTGYRIEIPPDLWQVDGDAGQLGQVIQNLVLNADQAMPAGGSVAIAARNLGEAEAGNLPGVTGRPQVLVSIRDTGVGIPEQHLGKIFDPYFTTKEKGSGLGLATSYSIVRNHAGQIRVTSIVGVGTEFLICLPALTGAAAQARPEPGPSACTPAARVLVMDDEEIIRDLSAELLAALGHEAETAANGEAALEKYRAAMISGRRFDAVILDLTVRGGMGGAEAVKRLAQIDPGVRAIVSSGYADNAAVADHRRFGFAGFLKKPYDIEALRGALDAVITSPAGS